MCIYVYLFVLIYWFSFIYLFIYLFRYVVEYEWLMNIIWIWIHLRKSESLHCQHIAIFKVQFHDAVRNGDLWLIGRQSIRG